MSTEPESARVLVELQSDPIDWIQAWSFLQSPEAGGHALFVGTTRAVTDGEETVELRYEAFAPMAVREMRRLAGNAMQRWPVLRCVIVHRTGTVPAGEASVFIGVSSAHRAEAFDACRFLIDELKTRVPIWKKEVFRSGRTEWVEGARPGSSE